MEKQLPCNIEAEQAVLGSIVIDPEAITQVADLLRPSDFYRNSHRVIYSAILSLYARREPADYITLCDELDSQDKMKDADGSDYIMSLINTVPTSGNLDYYAKIVKKKAEHRQIIHAAGQIAQWAYSGDEDAIIKAEEMLHRIGQGKSAGRGTSLKDAIDRFMTKLNILHENKGQITGIPTGFRTLDKILGGLQPSDLIVLAARPAVGKTSFVLNIALNIIKNALLQKLSIMMFSLEMGEEQLVRRLVSMEATVDQTRLRNGQIEDEQWDRLVDAAQTLGTDRMWIDDTPAITIQEMRARALRYQAEHGLDFILVDYMQLMRGISSNGKTPENRTQEVSLLSRGLKELARELNVPVIALAQLSRAVEQRQDKTPQLSDLRESGTIEQDADIVMFIHQNPETEIKENGYALDIIVAKHRNGPVGVDTLWFTPSLTKFSNVEEQFNAE